MVEDAVVIGAGPAGLSAALQLTRHGIMPLVFESGRAGGLLRNAGLVENYPGFPGGISGSDLADRFVRQALSAGVRIVEDEVTALRREGGMFQVVTNSETRLSRSAVVASGTKPIKLTGIAVGEPCEEKVIYEISSLLHTEGRHFAIVGAGDAAFDYALNLCRKNDVTVLNRSDKVKCLPLLRERAAACGINYLPNAILKEISAAADGRLLLKASLSGRPILLQADYVVGAAGRDPQTDFMSESLLDRFGELEKRGLLHMAGDVRNGMLRQTAIAAGNGIMTGMLIYGALRDSGREA